MHGVLYIVVYNAEKNPMVLGSSLPFVKFIIVLNSNNTQQVNFLWGAVLQKRNSCLAAQTVRFGIPD